MPICPINGLSVYRRRPLPNSPFIGLSVYRRRPVPICPFIGLSVYRRRPEKPAVPPRWKTLLNMDDLGGKPTIFGNIHIDTKNNGFRTGGVEARWAEEPFVFKKSDFFLMGEKT